MAAVFNNIKTCNPLRHMPALQFSPSKILPSNAVVLGEAVASEENDTVYLSHQSTSHIQKHTNQSFGKMLQKDLNAKLSYYVRNGKFNASWALFSQMHSAITSLDAYSFTPILRACSVFPEHGTQVHALMIKLGVYSEAISMTALMDMYSNNGYLMDSIKVFKEVKQKDVVTWNAFMSIFIHHHLPDQAIAVFLDMKRNGVQVSEFTLCSLLKASSLLKAFPQGKQVHSLVVVMGRDMLVLGTALIHFYSSVGHISEAMKVYFGLKCRLDHIILNSLISACIRNGKNEEAFSIMSTITPNVHSLTTILTACSENSNLLIGKQIHCVAIRFGFLYDTQLCNAILNMYAKCGKISTARLLFNAIKHKNVVSWTSMIDAYGAHGQGIQALGLFKLLNQYENGVLPNSVTFLVVLSACAHSGLVEEGRECFNMMRDKYGLEPGQEHYACFVDILSRAGQIEEIWCLFEDMIRNGTKPTAVVWTALLNASSLNLDVLRGEFAAKHLLELEPSKPGIYVLLSNFYAAIGKWDTVDYYRGIMRERGLLKEIGSSRVSVTNWHEPTQFSSSVCSNLS